MSVSACHLSGTGRGCDRCDECRAYRRWHEIPRDQAAARRDAFRAWLLARRRGRQTEERS